MGDWVVKGVPLCPLSSSGGVVEVGASSRSYGVEERAAQGPRTADRKRVAVGSHGSHAGKAR